MGKAEEKSELIKEEQAVLDKLIRQLDSLVLSTRTNLTKAQLKRKKQESSNLAEMYVQYVHENDDIQMQKEDLSRVTQIRDELYDTRLGLQNTTENEYMDLKVGLHSFMDSHGNMLICSWLRPVCRYFIFNNQAVHFTGVVEKTSTGEKTRTEYDLKMNRKVRISFDKVRDVTVMFPLSDEEREKLISDEFLETLKERRSESDFQNIVFSIQQRQAEIIQRPFEENLIIQGCAGSGKSMIMLHRLPVLLFDQGQSFSRKSIYIISPSETYIDMAYQMRNQLEISDLDMGTLPDYYNYVLSKYRIKPTEYGRQTAIPLTQEQERYAYSAQCREDMQREIHEKVYQKYDELTQLATAVQTEIHPSRGTAESDINRFFTASNEIQRDNRAILDSYLALMQDVMQSIRQLQDLLHKETQDKISEMEQFRIWNTPHDIREMLQYVISDADDYLCEKEMPEFVITMVRERKKLTKKQRRENLQEFLSRSDAFDSLDYAINSGKIHYCKRDIELFKKVPLRWDLLHHSQIGAFENTADYMDDVRPVLADSIMGDIAKIPTETEYLAIANREILSDWSNDVIEAVNVLIRKGIGDPIIEWSLNKQCKIVSDKTAIMLRMKKRYLSREEGIKAEKVAEYYGNLNISLPNTIYIDTIKRMGRKPILDANGNPGRMAMSCSPYLYLQIIYQIRGVNSVSQERLLAVDETQNLAPEEIRLLTAVNGDRCILNLYGDVDQHIEGTKGINSWTDFGLQAKEYTLNENYRNANQITEYCNKRFSMNMLPIALEGRGVHSQYSDLDAMDEQMQQLFTRPLQNGISAFLVKEADEAKFFKNHYRQFGSKLNDMSQQNEAGSVAINQNRWNLMTIDQAKGLEFNTVIAVTGHMTEHEKYISCTRALDELYLFDFDFSIKGTSKYNNTRNPTPTEKSSHSGTSKVKAAYQGQAPSIANSPLRDFFISHGLKIRDERPGSVMYVLGSKDEIGGIVDEARSKFGATGIYCRYPFQGAQYAWYTKSKK